MNILEKVKSLREQMYAAVEADDIDKVMEISKEWDSLDNGVTSEQLIFEASLVKNTNEEILKKKAYKLSYEEVKKFKELVRKENTYEDFLFGWYFKWDKTSKTYDEVNDEIWDKIDVFLQFDESTPFHGKTKVAVDVKWNRTLTVQIGRAHV